MATVNRKEEVVKTLLYESTLVNDWNMLKTILKNCWNKNKLFQNTYTETKDTLLHITCRHSYVESTKVLIEHGINPDTRNGIGDTCLHVAAKQGNGLILHLLFETGANPITKNNDEKLPVDMTDNQNVKELLRQYSLKSAELQLMKKFNTLKEIIAEEERKEHYERVNQSYYDNCIQQYNKVPDKSPLERIDSGICSDLDSNETLELESNDSPTSGQHQEDELSLVNKRLQSLHVTSSSLPKTIPKADHPKRRLFRSNHSGSWTSSSLPLPTSSSSSSQQQACCYGNSVVESSKQKLLTKTPSDNTSESASRRRRKSSHASTANRRSKRLSLPEFRIHGSTESYV